MQSQKFLIQILAILALFSATLADPSLEFDTSKLCTESYWLTINYFDAAAGDEIIFSGGVNGATRYVTYTVTASGSGSFGTYIVYPGPGANNLYFAQMRNSTKQLYEIDLNVAACTGLTTTGQPASKQAVWVADVFRKDTSPSSTGYFWNSHLQTAADDILTNSSACSSWTSTGPSPYLSARGYTSSRSYCLFFESTSADAGGFIQYLSSNNLMLQPNWDYYDEVAFAQDSTNKYWVIILATRPRYSCGNKYRSIIASEGCDDGNNNNNDGCDSGCNVEAGWTCSESVLTEGSSCVQGPVPPMAPVPVPVAAPVTVPQAETPTAGTPTAAPTSTPTAVPSTAPTSGTPTGSTPSGSTPSAVPSGSTPSATPQGSTPTGQTPTGQTPTGQTPSGQTPSSPASPSSPQGSTPSSPSSPTAAPSGSESPSPHTPADESPLPSQSPDGALTPSDAPTVAPSVSGPFSPRPSRTPADSGVTSGSEKITASVMMVIVTMLSVVIAF